MNIFWPKKKIFHRPRFFEKGEFHGISLTKPPFGFFFGRVFGRYNLIRHIVKLCIALFPFDDGHVANYLGQTGDPQDQQPAYHPQKAAPFPRVIRKKGAFP